MKLRWQLPVSGLECAQSIGVERSSALVAPSFGLSMDPAERASSGSLHAAFDSLFPFRAN